MRWAMTILFLVLGTGLGAGSACATTTVQVVATDPSADGVVLSGSQNFYLHLHYQSDRPVQIWVRPYFQGKAAHAGSNPSRVYPAGGGEALGWFFFSRPGTQVDEVRISAGDGSRGGTSVVAVYPVRVSAGGQPAAAQAMPDWVTRLRALDAAAQRADYERRMNTPISAGDRIVFSGFMLGMFAIGILGFVAPAWGLRRWRGGWRIAAAVPAALMAFVVLRILVNTSLAPTAHNLWPFEILMTGALSVVLMIALVLARKLTGANRAS